MYIYFTVIYFLFGISIGSFLNVCIWRIPQKLPIANDRSICPHCKKQLKEKDLIPILSWILLKGKCRYCGAPISMRYPLIEISTGILYAFSFHYFSLTLDSALFCLFASLLIVGAGIDYDHTYIPDSIHIYLIAIAILAQFFGNRVSLINALAGGFIVGAIMLLIAYFTHGGIGGGDIKLLTATGFYLGLSKNIFAFFLAYLFAFLWCILPLLRKKLNRKTEIPMIPFFAIALIVTALWGDRLLHWYFNLII